MPPSTRFHLGRTVAVLRRSSAIVEHQDRHHAVVLTELSPRSFAGSEPEERHRAVRVPRTQGRRRNGAGIGWIARRTYDYFLYVVIAFASGLQGYVDNTLPSLLCITMILRVRRNFFEITTFPNKKWSVFLSHTKKAEFRLVMKS